MERIAHMQGDSYRQTIESDKIRIETQKKSISSRIVNQVIGILQKFGSVSNVIETEQLQPKEDAETGTVSYDGKVIVNATISNREGTKKVTLPVNVVANSEVIEHEALNKTIESTPCAEIIETPITPTIDVSLSDFELADDGSEFIKVSHKVIGNDIGVIEKSILDKLETLPKNPTEELTEDVTKDLAEKPVDTSNLDVQDLLKQLKPTLDPKQYRVLELLASEGYIDETQGFMRPNYKKMLEDPMFQGMTEIQLYSIVQSLRKEISDLKKVSSQNKKAVLDMTKTPLEQVTEAYKESLDTCLYYAKTRFTEDYSNQVTLLDKLIKEYEFENVKDIVITDTQKEADDETTYYITVNYKNGKIVETSLAIWNDGTYEFSSKGIGFRFWTDIREDIEAELYKIEEESETPNLESMLKQAVLDETKDWNATINFTSTFVKPEVKKIATPIEDLENTHKFLRDFAATHANALKDKDPKDIEEFIRSYPELKDKLNEKHIKELIEEVHAKIKELATPVETASGNESEVTKFASLDSKFKQADSYNQHTERENFILSQKKQRIETVAANNLIKNLISLGYNSIKVTTSEASIKDDMLGDISIKASFYDNGVTKTADFTSPSDGNFDVEKIKESVSKAIVDNHIEEQITKEAEEKIKDIDSYQDWYSKTTEAAMKEKEVIPTGDAPATMPQAAQVHPVLYINKSVLPESLAIGDIYPISGLQYKVKSLSDSQLSKEKDSGSFVTFELVK